MTAPDDREPEAPEPAEPAELGAVGERATPKRGPGPAGMGAGRGPAAFMGGQPTEKSLNFKGSSRRLLAHAAPPSGRWSRSAWPWPRSA